MTEERRKELRMFKDFAKKVFEEIGSGDMSQFRDAFAKVAHTRDIWHNKNPGSYNYFFRNVEPRVKTLITRRLTQAELPLD